MLLSLLIAAVAGTASSCAVPPAEAERQAALAYSTFDSQPPPHGWRHLSAMGCTDAAVSMLGAYAAANAGGLSADAYAAVAPGSMRLRFIEGFLACPNEPYAKAVHCRP
jgi:hypothetical protein